MTDDRFARDPLRHMRQECDVFGWRSLCGSESVRSKNVALVEDWALVTCRGCQKKRIRNALKEAGHSELQIYEAAAKQLGVSY